MTAPEPISITPRLLRLDLLFVLRHPTLPELYMCILNKVNYRINSI